MGPAVILLIYQLWPPGHVYDNIVLVRQMLQQWCPHRAVSLQHLLQCWGHAMLSQAAGNAVIFADCQAACAPHMITNLQERGCCTSQQGLSDMQCSSTQVSGGSVCEFAHQLRLTQSTAPAGRCNSEPSPKLAGRLPGRRWLRLPAQLAFRQMTLHALGREDVHLTLTCLQGTCKLSCDHEHYL